MEKFPGVGSEFAVFSHSKWLRSTRGGIYFVFAMVAAFWPIFLVEVVGLQCLSELHAVLVTAAARYSMSILIGWVLAEYAENYFTERYFERCGVASSRLVVG